MDKNFWQNKRVLITGHTGFKGAWLALRLWQLGAKVSGLALPQDNLEAVYHVTNLKEYLTQEFFGDVADTHFLQSTLKQHEFDVIFHLAAQSLVLEGYQDPLKTYQTNVIGTLNILNVFKMLDVAKVCLIVTSDKCYDNKENGCPFVEDDQLGGKDIYSSSKGCCELLTSAYRHSFFNNGSEKVLATARAGNVIGGGDYAPNRLIPDCIKSLRKNERIVLRHPNAIRPWQHVIDVITGYIILAEKMWQQAMHQIEENYGCPWNFAPSKDEAYSVEEVVQQVIKAYGSGSYITSENNEAPYEASCLRLDATKANSLLKWDTHFSLPEAISLTIDWYKADPKDTLDLTFKQFSYYDTK